MIYIISEYASQGEIFGKYQCINYNFYLKNILLYTIFMYLFYFISFTPRMVVGIYYIGISGRYYEKTNTKFVSTFFNVHHIRNKTKLVGY